MTTGSHRRIWVVVPAYREGAAIGAVVAELVAAGWDVVVVDDGSPDDTAAVAHAAGARVVRHAVNLGQGAALQTGIDFALARGAGCIVTFDADGQHGVEDVPALIAAVDAGADIALGSRFLAPGGAAGAGIGRRLLLRAAVRASNLLAGGTFTDAHCGLRAFSAAAAPALRIAQDRMAHASELLRNVCRHGLRFVEVPVVVRYTAYSRRKGQRGLDALRIVFDHFFHAGGDRKEGRTHG
jgi:glycosyltransferase involved in cell wall biosynthesis